MHRRSIAVCTTLTLSFLALASAAQASGKSIPQKRQAAIISSRHSKSVPPRYSRPASARNASTCWPCSNRVARKSNGLSPKKREKTAKNLPCHPKNYLDPKIARNYKAALRDMKRAGIKPKITSAWRSSNDQAQLRRCSLSVRCRTANPGLYRALPAGKSLHEAGFAVDIGGVATGPRGGKQMTSQGRRIVGIMRKNGFKWRYGLADPAHFEADPKKYGYRTAEQAISRTQSTCQVRLARNKAHKKRGGRLAHSSPKAKVPSVATSTRPHRRTARVRA